MAPSVQAVDVSLDVLRKLDAMMSSLQLKSHEDVIRHLLTAASSSSSSSGNTKLLLPRTSFFDAMPFDVAGFLMTYLDSPSLRACGATCRRWSRLIQGSPVLRPLSEGGWAGIYVIGGIRSNSTRLPSVSALNELSRFNPVYKTWHTMPPMAETRYHCAAVCLDHQLFVIGGRDNKNRLASVEKYDILARTWTPLPPMKTIRSAPAVATYNGCIYIFGGYDGKTEHRTIEKFDPQTNAWVESANRMPVEACEVSAVVCGRDIFVIGGTQSRYSQRENILAVCQKYSPAEDKWMVMSPMKQKRMCPAAVLLDGKIFVIGGSNGVASLDVVEIYDPKTDVWSPAPPMNICRSNATACVYQGEIYVAGGFCSGALDTVEKYSPQTNQWCIVTRMPFKRDACKLIAIE